MDIEAICGTAIRSGSEDKLFLRFSTALVRQHRGPRVSREGLMSGANAVVQLDGRACSPSNAALESKTFRNGLSEDDFDSTSDKFVVDLFGDVGVGNE